MLCIYSQMLIFMYMFTSKEENTSAVYDPHQNKSNEFLENESFWNIVYPKHLFQINLILKRDNYERK